MTPRFLRLGLTATLGLLLHASLPGPAEAADPGPTLLRGRIVDASSALPVYRASVTVGPATATTDREGRFELPLAPGPQDVIVRRLGYEDLHHPGVVLSEGGTTSVELALTPLALRLEEMTVTPGAFSFMDNSGSTRQTMSREDILSVPQLGEDVFRAVNRLPGLSSGDYAAHFSIRGGRHDETLILLDGLELYEPYHLKDFNEGAISIVDAETIQGVQLLTGGFPAAYGNKRSGVFDITSRVVDPEEIRASLGASFLNARGLGMGPVGARGTWLASARSGYMDLVFSLINQNDLPSPRYHDVFAKVDLEVAPDHRFTADLLHAGDRYTFNAASTTGFNDSLRTREKANNHYGNSNFWMAMDSDLAERVSVRNQVSASLVTRDRDGYEKYVDRTEPLYEVRNHRDLTILGFKQDWTLRAANRFVVATGVDARRLKATDRLTSVVGQDPNDPAQDPNQFYPVTTSTSKEATGHHIGAYASNRWRPADPLVLEFGGRYDRASHTGDRDFSPRVSASLRIGEGRMLRAGWGHYRQFQSIDDVAALNPDQTYYASELSTQVTAGIEQSFADGGTLRIEAYRKEGSELRPAYRNWKGGIDVFPESNEDRILVFPTSSLSRGIEIYYDRQMNARVRLRASYAIASSEETVRRIDNVNGEDPIAFDATHPTPQDQRHAANLDMTYRLASAWSLTTSLAFHTGWPATLEEMVATVDGDGNPDTTIRPQKVYGARLPSYQRLDVRATRRWTTGHGDWRFFAELVNLTNHANVFGYDYYRSFDADGNLKLRRDSEQWFTILPSVGISWTATF